MPPAAMSACGHSVTATLNRNAALVPSETSVFMLALPWRSAIQAPRWNAQPTQNCTGRVSTSWTQGSVKARGTHGKRSGKLPSRTGTDRPIPAMTLRRSPAISRARAACSRSGASDGAGAGRRS